MDTKFVLFFIILGLASSSAMADYIGLIGYTATNTGRNLLQQKTSCSVNFENQNYTIITSQCKGPNYNKTTCCDAFKQFACPHADQISDMKTNCADTLFSYINLYGKYPPGLFANLCSDKDGGVNCDGVDFKKADPNQSSCAFLKTNMISVMMVVTGSSMMVLWSLMV